MGWFEVKSMVVSVLCWCSVYFCSYVIDVLVQTLNASFPFLRQFEL